jgi:hypothetical protein
MKKFGSSWLYTLAKNTDATSTEQWETSASFSLMGLAPSADEIFQASKRGDQDQAPESVARSRSEARGYTRLGKRHALWMTHLERRRGSFRTYVTSHSLFFTELCVSATFSFHAGSSLGCMVVAWCSLGWDEPNPVVVHYCTELSTPRPLWRLIRLNHMSIHSVE